MPNIATHLNTSTNTYANEVATTAESILAILFEQRRLLPGADNCEVAAEAEKAPHIAKLVKHVAEEKPITMALPGFPAKSPNRRKTLGPFPDFGEYHALNTLDNLCSRIREVYPPGAKVTICSDGRVFADLVRISDEDVTTYRIALREYAASQYPDTIDFFDLDDVYTHISDFDTLREELLIEHGEPLRSLRSRCKADPHTEAMYKGITRFLFEDYLGIEPYCKLSRTSVQKIARQMAYRVIQRSNAWTRLLQKCRDYTIRLSIHPQPKVSEKIGVFLVESEDVWRTPWHSVAVRNNDMVRLVPRATAEEEGLSLVFRNGLPSHFEHTRIEREVV